MILGLSIIGLIIVVAVIGYGAYSLIQDVNFNKDKNEKDEDDG